MALMAAAAEFYYMAAAILDHNDPLNYTLHQNLNGFILLSLSIKIS